MTTVRFDNPVLAEKAKRLTPQVKKLIAKLPGIDQRNVAIALAGNYYTAADQVAAFKQAFGPKKVAQPAPATPGGFFDKASQEAYVKKVRKLETGKVLRHNAEVHRQYVENDPLIPLNEALARHQNAPGSIEGMTGAILQSCGLQSKQANGLFLVEVKEGKATGCWQVTESLDKLGFWKRVKIFLALIFGVQLSSPVQPRTPADIVDEMAEKDVDEIIQEVKKDLEGAFKAAAKERRNYSDYAKY